MNRILRISTESRMDLKLTTVSRDLLEKNSLQLINSPPLGERGLWGSLLSLQQTPTSSNHDHANLVVHITSHFF
jgi:hypothetical protein